MPDGIDDVKSCLPITKGICVLASEPTDEVTVIEVETEQGYTHAPGSLFVNGVIVGGGALFSKRR
jgi:hypothetical protein